MQIKEKDFIEIEFTGKTKEGGVFDSTLKEELDKLNKSQENKIEAKPFIFCVGQDMFLKSLDSFLIGKEIGKKYDVELKPEEAFGKRDPSLIQKIPLSIFMEQKINPTPGTTLNFDGRVGKVLTVSGGRVMVDFNHLLAGKEVAYHINILRKVDSLEEKIKALNEFLFRKEFDYNLEKENNKIVFKVEKPFVKFVEMFKDKFKETLGFNIDVKEIEKIKEISKEKTEENKKSQ